MIIIGSMGSMFIVLSALQSSFDARFTFFSIGIASLLFAILTRVDGIYRILKNQKQDKE